MRVHGPKGRKNSDSTLLSKRFIKLYKHREGEGEEEANRKRPNASCIRTNTYVRLARSTRPLIYIAETSIACS